MYLKNSNFALYLGLALVVGFAASSLIYNYSGHSNLLGGDISKAARYSNMKEDPDMAVMVEKLQNDEQYYNDTKEVLSFIKSRVDSLAKLTERTIGLCSDVPELQSSVAEISALYAKSFNTNQSLASVLNGLDKMADGKAAPGYEQASNNAYVGFNKIEKRMGTGSNFVETASAYIQGKNDEKSQQIASLVAEWSVYCVQDALLNKDKDKVAYWNQKYKNFMKESATIASAFGKLNLAVEDIEIRLSNGPDTFGGKLSNQDETMFRNDGTDYRLSNDDDFSGRLSESMPEMDKVLSDAMDDIFNEKIGLENEDMVRNEMEEMVKNEGTEGDRF